MSGAVVSAGGISGRYFVEVIDANGVIRERLTCPNLITDYGLNAIGNADGNNPPLRWGSVGTSSVPPSIGDTQLGNRLATADISSNSVTNVGAPTYSSITLLRYVFSLGAVVGNITELGVGRSSSGTELFSRALIVDALGNPTSVTVLATEQLAITYEITLMPDLTIKTGSLNLGFSTHTYRASIYSANTAVTMYGHRYIGGGNFNPANLPYSFGPVQLVPITAAPPTTNVLYGAWATGYVNNSRIKGISFAAGLAEMNNAAGVGYLTHSGAAGCYPHQFEFTPPIPKDSTKNFNMQILFTWDRA